MAHFSRMAAALTPQEFERALQSHPHLSQRAREVARAVLVDGCSYAELLQRFGPLQRQLAHEWASKLYDVFCPEGWVTRQITLPPELMAQVEKMEEQARERWETDNPPRIVRRRGASA